MTDKQLLHLVFGGELESLEDTTFADVQALDLVGIFPDYDTAFNAWKGSPSVPSTMPGCATSSSICTAFLIQKTKIILTTDVIPRF